MNSTGAIRATVMVMGLACAAEAVAATHGRVTDLNGAPLAQAMVTLTKSMPAAGATATTVFTGDTGEFSFPAQAPSQPTLLCWPPA